MRRFEAKHKDCTRVGLKTLAHLGWALLAGCLACQAPLWPAQKPGSTQVVSPVQASKPAAPKSSPASRTGSSYVVAKDDLLDIYVVGVQELSREYRVNADGLITLPMVQHPVMAAGLSLEELAKAIRKELLDGAILTDPDVVVTVKSSTLNSVVLSGAVKKPGIYPIYGHTMLLELLTQAEGLRDDAGSIAIITRGDRALIGRSQDAAQAEGDTAHAGSRMVEVDVWRLWQNGDASLDLELYPGDRVLVQHAGIVYVMGAVNRAGGFVLSNDQEKMTVLKAVALAGSLTRDAKPSKAVIMRNAMQTAGGGKEVPIDLKLILSKHAPDELLLASDILYVPESGAKRTLHSVIDAAVYTTLWHVPY